MKKSFIDKLDEEFGRRKLINSRYSLRAYARDLGIEPSMLSKILRRRIPLTVKMLNRLSILAGVTDVEYRHYLRELEETQGSDIFETQNLLKEELRICSEWFGFVMVELPKLDGFKSDPRWIAKKLGITVSEVKEMIEILLDLGALERGANGTIRTTREVGDGFKVASEDPKAYMAACKKRWRQVFEYYYDSVEKIKPKMRAYNVIVSSVDSELVPEINRELDSFIRKLISKMEKKSKKKDSVYEVDYTIFPMTK